ncbi:MAG: hypothetical protein ACTTGJ_03135 [Clostridium sp.]
MKTNIQAIILGILTAIIIFFISIALFTYNIGTFYFNTNKKASFDQFYAKYYNNFKNVEKTQGKEGVLKLYSNLRGKNLLSNEVASKLTADFNI